MSAEIKENKSLVVIGTGIKLISQLTVEAITYIKQSKRLLYLVNEPLIEQWIIKNNSTAESLYPIYISSNLRAQSYKRITEYILDVLEEDNHVCVAFYGHPCFIAKPALDAVNQALQKKHYAKILPGISAEDCLFADLKINPGDCGYQAYEATDFLIYNRIFSPQSHLVLWQIGFVGNIGHPKYNKNKEAIIFLVKYLCQFYNLKHTIIIYEASLYPNIEPKIKYINLESLPNEELSNITTLYIPPIGKAKPNKELLDKLKISL